MRSCSACSRRRMGTRSDSADIRPTLRTCSRGSAPRLSRRAHLRAGDELQSLVFSDSCSCVPGQTLHGEAAAGDDRPRRHPRFALVRSRWRNRVAPRRGGSGEPAFSATGRRASRRCPVAASRGIWRGVHALLYGGRKMLQKGLWRAAQDAGIVGELTGALAGERNRSGAV